MRALTDADFNASGREISMRLDIYFNGPSQPPLSVTKDDYLIDASWLEEGSAESANPFGAVSANELSFRLFNKQGIFSPTNVSSPYYGKIKTNLRIIPFIRVEDAVEEAEWQQLGIYYVASWDAAVTGTYVDIVAYDIWQQIFSSPAPNYPVQRDVPFNVMATNVYELMGIPVIVNPALNKVLAYSFIQGTPLSFTQEIAEGALAFCTSSKAGEPILEPFIMNRSLRATLTDNDQIKSANVKPSISKTYEGVELTYAIPTGAPSEVLVELVGLKAPGSTFSLDNIAFNNGPVWLLTSLKTRGGHASIVRVNASPWQVSLGMTITDPDVPFDLTVHGQVVSFTDITIADAGTKLLKAQNRYIQNADYAAQYKGILSAFASESVPTLKLSVRGNPLFKVGDKITVISDTYELNYTGVIQRMEYNYDGALSCDMTLLKDSILQGVI